MKRPYYLAVFFWMLQEAEHGMIKENREWRKKKESELKHIIFNGKPVRLRAGQFTMGAQQLASISGVPRGTVERVIKCFKSEEMIEVQTSNRFSLYTVKNWEQYQMNEELNEEKMRNKRGASEEPVRTPEECKNDKHENKRESGEQSSLTPKEISKKFFEDKTQQEELLLFFAERGANLESIRAELDKFIRYWTELDPSGRKQRWEKQPTFEVKKRLITWFGKIQSRQTQFSRPTFNANV